MKKMVIFSGLPGSGKSTLAEALGKRVQWPLFSVDPIESAMLRSGCAKSFETGLAAYLVVEALVVEQLKLGLSVLIDAVNSVQEARDMWYALAGKHEATLYIVECILPADLHRKRIEARVRGLHGIPEVTWEQVEEGRETFLPWKEKRLVVDTSQVKEENIVCLLEYVGEVER
jgi:predicted kinase